MLRGGDIRGLLLCCYFGLQQQQPQSVSPMSFLTLIPTMQYLTSFISIVLHDPSVMLGMGSEPTTSAPVHELNCPSAYEVKLPLRPMSYMPLLGKR